MTDLSSSRTSSTASDDVENDDEIDVVNDAASSHDKSGRRSIIHNK